MRRTIRNRVSGVTRPLRKLVNVIARPNCATAKNYSKSNSWSISSCNDNRYRYSCYVCFEWQRMSNLADSWKRRQVQIVQMVHRRDSRWQTTVTSRGFVMVASCCIWVMWWDMHTVTLQWTASVRVAILSDSFKSNSDFLCRVNAFTFRIAIKYNSFVFIYFLILWRKMSELFLVSVN